MALKELYSIYNGHQYRQYRKGEIRSEQHLKIVLQNICNANQECCIENARINRWCTFD